MPTLGATEKRIKTAHGVITYSKINLRNEIMFNKKPKVYLMGGGESGIDIQQCKLILAPTTVFAITKEGHKVEICKDNKIGANQSKTLYVRWEPANHIAIDVLVDKLAPLPILKEEAA